MLKGKLGWLLRIAATVILFAVTFVFLAKPGDMVRDLQHVVIGWLLAATGVKSIGILSSILRWDQLLRGQGYRAPLGYLAGSFLVGRFFGMFLPSTLGLDGYRAYDVARRAHDAAGSVAVIVVEKVTGFFTLSLLVLVTLPAGLHFLPRPVLAVVFALFCVPAILSFVLLLRPAAIERVAHWLLRLRFPGKARVEGFLRRSVAAVTAYEGQPTILLRSVLLAVVGHSATVLVYYFCARAIAAGAGLTDMIFVGPWIILATVGIPTLGGEGAREFTAVGLLSLIGVTNSQAFLVGNLGFWSGEFIPVVLGGLILAFRPARYVPRIRRAAEPSAAQASCQEPEAASQPACPAARAELTRSRQPAREVASRVSAIAAAGLLAGMAVGVLETVLLALLGAYAGHLHAMLWAVVAYGLLGLVAGLCVGIVAALLVRRSGSERSLLRRGAALTLAGTFSALALFVVRYRLYRDLFDEGIRLFTLKGLLFNGGLLVFFVALFFLMQWLLSRRAFRWLASLPASPAGSTLLLVIACMVTLLSRPALPKAQTPQGISPSLENTPNIVLIGVDTLRADRLSCYGYTASRTPNIDSLAAGGVRYSDMTAQASWTKPSFGTILTGLYPSSHTAVGKLDRLPQAVTTLPEALAARGYYTGGFVNNISISPTFGFDQGFADFAYLSPSYLFGAGESASQLGLYQGLRRVWARLTAGRIYVSSFYQDASTVNKAAIQWLSDAKGARFFLFLHYMDPHDPYFEHPFNGRGFARASNQSPDPALAPTLSRLYDGEVAYLDGYLGALFDWLKAEGLYDDALIILTADHGEEFQEHGGWWHGQTLYQEQIAVPLIIKYPGGARAGTVVTEPARSLDVAPTVLDTAGLPVPDAMLGRSLWSLREPPGAVFSEEDLEGNQVYALRSGEYKLIRANAGNPRGLPAESVYQLATDPGEQHRIDPATSALTIPIEQLRTLLHDSLAVALERSVAGEATDLDSAAWQKLHDLGY